MDHSKEEQLTAAGVDLTGSIARFAGNKMLYFQFLHKFPKDPTFPQLATAVTEADWATAQEAVHTLKGVAGNLGLTAVYEASARMVKELRNGDTLAAKGTYETLREAYEAILTSIGSEV